MNNSNKEQIGCDGICKSHSARTERDLYRICPSKLSKRELEDLYFALLENNLELKKNINIYQDKIKVLSTKLQRMTVQKNVTGKEKDCCASKTVVNEQRESLTELKKTNERMADRIRLLNMRLCSTKQFLKRSPSQSNSCKTCTRCSFKNSSMSALNPKKKSDSNMKTTAVSCQFFDKDVSEKATRTVETETDSPKPEKGDTEQRCNENKCKTVMDELKEKINNLQEELATSHSGYSERIAKLESLVSELHDENLRVRSAHVASEHTIQQRMNKANLLQDQLRTADAKCNELIMELSIEKRKVAELETGLKLANLSNHVIETIDQLAATKEEDEKQEPQVDLSLGFCQFLETTQINEEPADSNKDKQEVKEDECKNEPQIEISRGFSCVYVTKQSNEEPVSSAKGNNDLKIIEISRESSRSQRNDELASPSKILELPTSSKKPDVNSKSDDSGYTELNRSNEVDDDQAMVKMNRELLKKIAELQTQLDVVKIAAAGENVKIQHMRKPRAFESYDKETHDDESNILNPLANLSITLLRDMPASDTNEKKYQNETESSDAPNSPPLSSVAEGEPSTSRPWENLLIKEQSVEENVENAIADTNNTTAKVKFDTKPAKDDDHNSYQIPGPLPAVYPLSQNSKDRRKSLRNQNISKESLERLKKKANSEEKTVKIFEDSEIESAAGKADESSLISGTDYDNEDRSDPDNQRRSLTIEEAKLAYRTPTRDSIYVNKKKLTRDESTMAEVKKESETTYYFDSLCTLPLANTPVVNNLMKETSTQVDEKPGYELCEARATICRCPSRRRDVAVFRSCSGTLRFRTSAATQGLRRCDCQSLTERCAPQMDSRPARRDSATYTADVPYTAPERRSRATSPNTDQEISSLSDLPSEKDGKNCMSPPPGAGGSPRVSLSPGEEKGTMTLTDTETETEHIDYGSLSEGEMPATKKARKVSAGEWTSDTSPPVATSSERMEATLQSITEELARCRRLLLNQRSQENSAQTLFRREREPDSTKEELGIALRQSAANRHIVESNSLSCVFILHIGTLVLSDESVLYCRDKTLLLTWKFYTQNAAMTRVQSGRVVQFDFVTEYDVAFNDDFLDYMKNSDMAIVLCEMKKQDEPFAICSLPLREALLHANRRADMSLALVPASNGGQRDSIGDEIGILDLWCTLRVDVSLMPTIHRVMHTPSPPNVYSNPLRQEDRESKIIQQAVDDEVSSERLSRDLDLSITKHGNSSGKQSNAPELFSEKFNPRTSQAENESNLEKKSNRYDDEVQGYQATSRRRSSQTQKSTPSSDLGHKGTVGFKKRWPPTQLQQESSGIIINEVPAFIRSSDDMKLALERNVQHDMPRMPKMDDESSHFHSSIGSVKSSAVRHQLSRLKLNKNKLLTRERIDSLEELLKKKASSIEDSSSVPLASTEGYVRDQDSERSKMINISKYVATTPEMSKIDASKKSVKYNDTLACDELQKESSADSDDAGTQSIDITILWLALNEECEAMVNSSIQKLYVAYSFLGHRGADLETPFSLPKPKHYADKCYFNFKKTFHLHESDLPLLGHMSRCRAGGGASTDPRDCIVFTLISEPAEDPLGLSNCEDIGYAYLYLGDVLAYSGDSAGYTEVVGVRGVRGGVCGVLAVRVDQLPVLRRALALAHSRTPGLASALPSCHLE